MRFEEPAAEFRSQLVPDLGSLLGALLLRSDPEARAGIEGVKLHESCRELILDLPAGWVEDLAAQGLDYLERYRRPALTWYHELRRGRSGFGFGRSVEDGGSRVIEVAASRVAQEFIDTVEWLDTFPPPPELGCSPRDGHRSTVRLLCVPRYGFYALAAIADERIDGVFPFFRQVHRLERKQGYSRAEFLDFLPKLKPFFGVEEPDRREEEAARPKN